MTDTILLLRRNYHRNNNNLPSAKSSLPLLQERSPSSHEVPIHNAPVQRTGEGPLQIEHSIFWLLWVLVRALMYLKTVFFLSVNIYNSVKNPRQLVMHFEVC